MVRETCRRAASADKSWFMTTLAIVLPAALSFVFGWIVEPSFFGSSMQLHEITVLVALVFWGALWGIAGAVLSVPILVVTKICLEKVRPASSDTRCLAPDPTPNIRHPISHTWRPTPNTRHQTPLTG